jgi:hypothetical protein
MLIGNALSISILQWCVMPVLTKVLGPWLNATDPRQKAVSFGGPFLIALLLTAFVVIFRQFKG